MSVTVVLIGTETASRKYVNYEIEQSHNRGNGLLAVRIHNLKDRLGSTSPAGLNPFDMWHVETPQGKTFFSDRYRTYDWVLDNGRPNFAGWIENAARTAGR